MGLQRLSGINHRQLEAASQTRKRTAMHLSYLHARSRHQRGRWTRWPRETSSLRRRITTGQWHRSTSTKTSVFIICIIRRTCPRLDSTQATETFTKTTIMNTYKVMTGRSYLHLLFGAWSGILGRGFSIIISWLGTWFRLFIVFFFPSDWHHFGEEGVHMIDQPFGQTRVHRIVDAISEI
jgi:hypothetical protein